MMRRNAVPTTCEMNIAHATPRQFWAMDQWGMAGQYFNYALDTEWDAVEDCVVANSRGGGGGREHAGVRAEVHAGVHAGAHYGQTFGVGGSVAYIDRGGGGGRMAGRGGGGVDARAAGAVAVPMAPAAAYPELVRWGRLLRVEEAQQAADIRRYDLHDAPLTHTGQTVPALGWPTSLEGGATMRSMLTVETYKLEVPGLIEGFPPMAGRCHTLPRLFE